MKLLHTSAGIVALILLHACSSQPAQDKASQTTTGAAVDNKPLLINTSLKAGAAQHDINYPLNARQQLSVPEAQIIRELYQSGCLIEEVEINRRVQHMRISCANDKPFSSSI